MTLFPKLVKAVIIAVFALSLVACGGGGGPSYGSAASNAAEVSGGNAGGGGNPGGGNTGGGGNPGGGNTGGGGGSYIPPSNNFNGTGTASLNWVPPATYENGSSFTDLVGHHIYMNDGTGYIRIATTVIADQYDFYLVEKLSKGTFTFAVTAYDSQGYESAFSSGETVVINS